ncbi:MAG: hypothetical protein JWN49_708 [Parcubacteria group bacterium]|nr:hypothetical protein [Parcubacteria group bacterium]
MTRFGWIITTCIILFSAGVLLLLVVVTSHRTSPATVTSTENSVPLTDLSSLAIYSSGTYGFSFFYPATATVTDQFSSSTNTGRAWRENPLATGTLITRIAVDGGEVRIGMSQAIKELTACTKTGPAEKAVADINMGSTTWKAFSFDKLGTDVEQHVMSYRTLHDKACFALEAFAPRVGVSTTTQSGLDAVIQSFTFAQP